MGELVVIERGGSPRPIDDYITDSPDGLNWVKIGDAPEQGNYITSTKEKIRPEGLSKTREVHPGDLILSNSMSFGKPYIMAIDGCIHDGWLSIKNTNNVFDLKFLCVLLGTDQMLTQYKSMAAGSTVNNLNKELVGNTTVTYPSVEEQRTIGQFFEEIENLITIHQRKYIHYLLYHFSTKNAIIFDEFFLLPIPFYHISRSEFAQLQKIPGNSEGFYSHNSCDNNYDIILMFIRIYKFLVLLFMNSMVFLSPNINRFAHILCHALYTNTLRSDSVISPLVGVSLEIYDAAV